MLLSNWFKDISTTVIISLRDLVEEIPSLYQDWKCHRSMGKIASSQFKSIFDFYINAKL